MHVYLCLYAHTCRRLRCLCVASKAVQLVSSSDLFLPEALQWIGAEIRQNLSHFPPQLLPPHLLLSFQAQQTRKLPPGQETLPQHPSEVQADGGTDGNRASEQ